MSNLPRLPPPRLPALDDISPDDQRRVLKGVAFDRLKGPTVLMLEVLQREGVHKV